MKVQWFTRKEGLPLPSSFVGWVIVLAAAAYLVWKFIDIDSRSHSVSDTLMNFAFQGVIVVGIYVIVAFSTSTRSEETKPR